MSHCPWWLLASVVGLLPWASGAARAEKLTLTLTAEYRYTGAAPSPTAFFTLSFDVDRTPDACGGSEGGVLVCGVTAVRYTNGPLDLMLAIAEPPSVLFYTAAKGGGFALFQNDLRLNRLSFVVASAPLWSGTLASPSLIDGVYPIIPSADWTTETRYPSYAGQGLASGDPSNNPFHDPQSLQSYNPLVAGSIRVASAVPEPGRAGLLLLGLATAALLRRRVEKRPAAAPPVGPPC